MPSILSDDDKETVKRTVPKAANKIHAVAVARLYIAYPNKQRWTYTGVQGAAVLANDLVGNTFWIKMVDISVRLPQGLVIMSLLAETRAIFRVVLQADNLQPSNRGVLWDQEIYDTFSYNQDRTFFHSFELENCAAGLSFVDEKEAKQFKKKMDEREKNASKSTKATMFGSGGRPPLGAGTNGKSHGLLGGIGNLLHGHRSSSAPSIPMPQPVVPAREAFPLETPFSTESSTSSSARVDPSLLEELRQMGITEDLIEHDWDFIRTYIEQKQASESSNALDDSSVGGGNNRKGSAPPPPPPPNGPPGRQSAISPQNTGSTIASRRGPPPAPPPSRRSRPDRHTAQSSSPQLATPPDSPARDPSPPPGPPPSRFKAPPPLVDAGKNANTNSAHPPSRVVSNTGPAPPPRPPKTPMDETVDHGPKFAVPPPFHGNRVASAIPPPPPSRGSAPTAPSPGDSPNTHALPYNNPAPPPLPPKTPNAPTASLTPPPPPPMPNRNNAPSAPPPPPLPSLSRPIPPALPAPDGDQPPPPPPMPSTSGPPPPPLPPGREPMGKSSIPSPAGGKEDVLASIRASGGIGGGRLKKVSDSERRDRSAALGPGPMDGAPGARGSSPTPNTSAEGGLAGALFAALEKRKAKVSASGKFPSGFICLFSR